MKPPEEKRDDNSEIVERQGDQRRRPGPLRWIWYAFGGSLGPRYREWVLRDLTCRTRWGRQLIRGVVQVLPVAVVLLVVLGFEWISGVGVGCGLVLGLIYSAAYFDQAADHRIVKHGYPSGTIQRILSERDNAKHADRLLRYIQTYRSNTDEGQPSRRTTDPSARPPQEGSKHRRPEAS
jgi:uncharacterized protein DUF5313